MTTLKPTRVARQMPPPGASGGPGGGANPMRNMPPANRNTMLYAGLAAGAVAAYYLWSRRSSAEPHPPYRDSSGTRRV
jgi:hypothetical protein